MSRAPAPYPVSDHCDGRRFFNPGVDTDKSLADLLRWRRSPRPAAWPRTPATVSGAAAPAAPGPGDIAVTLVGQATVLIQVAGLNILTDPIFSDRASPLPFAGPRRVRPPAPAIRDLPPIHLVLLSHNHYDHLDVASLRTLGARFAPKILTGLGNAAFLGRRGIGGVRDLDWWEQADVGAGATATFVPAQHWSSRTLRDRRTTLWGGFVLRTPSGTIYFAGDTGYAALFGDIARRMGPPDVALLPIGAYEPRWFMALQHMNPDDAVRAHRDLGAALSLGVHWGTFQLTDEAIDAPLRALEAARTAHGIAADAFIAPAFGRPVLWRRDVAEPPRRP